MNRVYSIPTESCIPSEVLKLADEVRFGHVAVARHSAEGK
jgi:hypothetical protein